MSTLWNVLFIVVGIWSAASLVLCLIILLTRGWQTID